jgi:hypothetical protein
MDRSMKKMAITHVPIICQRWDTPQRTEMVGCSKQMLYVAIGVIQ